MKILIVDDLKTERLLMRSYLEPRGFQILEAEDGETALALCALEKPDLVLLDIVLPKADGFQVCRRIKRDPELKATPVILVSSKTQESDRFWGLRQGASDYLNKPLQAAQVLSAVEKHLVPA
ncbi:MAG: response regulator [Verrucomicrobia bacterium]|nr:response regulator [Verrucomicrobiota bacterium]